MNKYIYRDYIGQKTDSWICFLLEMEIFLILKAKSLLVAKNKELWKTILHMYTLYTYVHIFLFWLMLHTVLLSQKKALTQQHEWISRVFCLINEARLRGYILYGSIYMTFYRNGNRLVVEEPDGGRRADNKDAALGKFGGW